MRVAADHQATLRGALSDPTLIAGAARRSLLRRHAEIKEPLMTPTAIARTKTQEVEDGQDAAGLMELDGDRATRAANVQATHVLASAIGDPTFTLGGRYDIALRRTYTLTVQSASGNRAVMTDASEASER
jgi:hypothetical protein